MNTSLIYRNSIPWVFFYKTFNYVVPDADINDIRKLTYLFRSEFKLTIIILCLCLCVRAYGRVRVHTVEVWRLNWLFLMCKAHT